jgi:hypothetical protein
MSEASLRAGRRDFSIASLFWRFAGVLALVVATYNPTRFSYGRWLMSSMGAEPSSLGPEHFVVGVILLAGWAILIVATQRSLGAFGLLLLAAIIGGIVWWLTDLGIVSVASVTALTWVILICLSLLLAVGLSWSHIWRRLTGQVEVDDNDT